GRGAVVPRAGRRVADHRRVGPHARRGAERARDRPASRAVARRVHLRDGPGLHAVRRGAARGPRPAIEEAMMTGTSAAPLLSVQDLEVTFRTEAGPATAVRGVTFDVRAGETVAV